MEELLVATEVPSRVSCNTRIHKNPNIFNPSLDIEFFHPIHVSIGPYYMNMVHETFDYWKLRFAKRFVSEDVRMFYCMHHKLRNMAAEFKGYYDIDSGAFKLSDDQFTSLMVLDGCFILGFIQYCLFDDRYTFSEFGYDCYEYYNEIRSDLFLLENQIPYKVLTELMKFVPYGNWDNKIQRFINYGFLVPIPSSFDEPEKTYDPVPATTSHLLELLETTLTKEKHCGIEVFDILTSSSTAVDFKRFGRVFGSHSSRSLAYLDYETKHRKTCLTLPSIVVTKSTQRVLANLLCQEVFSGAKWITMYVCLLHSLIKDYNDLEVLQKAGVLITSNLYYTDPNVLYLLNELRANLTPPNFQDLC